MSTLPPPPQFEAARASLRSAVHTALEKAPALYRDSAAAMRQWIEGPATYPDFCERVPIQTKRSLFANHELVQSALKQGLGTGSFKKLIPSAGTSSSLISFRVLNLQKEAGQFQKLLQRLKQEWQIDETRTLLINAYPAGIQLPPSLHSIECGARLDLLPKIYSELTGAFDQVVLITQPPMLRYAIDQKLVTAEQLRRTKIVLGGTWFAYSFIDWIADRTEIPIEVLQSQIASFYGIAEVGLGIGFQGIALADVRRKHSMNNGVPMLFEMHPEAYFLEEVEGKLLVTQLDPDPYFPMLRYETGDRGRLLPDGTFEVYGRTPPEGMPVTAEKLEEFIFENPILRRQCTGDFILSPQRLLLQTRSGVLSAEMLRSMTDELRCILPATIEITCVTDLEERSRMDLLRKPVKYG